MGIYLSEGTTELNITLAAIPAPTANLYGVVTNEVGEPISTAKITLNGLTCYSDSSGNYFLGELDSGSYTLVCEKAGYLTETKSVQLSEGDNPLNITLALPPIASLFGVVTNEAGLALSGVKVTIDGLVDYTDAYGRYRFEGLSPGNYTVTFEKEGYKSQIW